ncbi:unnamed protein product [Rhodiola kirilowii]
MQRGKRGNRRTFRFEFSFLVLVWALSVNYCNALFLED